MDTQTKLIAAGGIAVSATAAMWWLDKALHLSYDMSSIIGTMGSLKALRPYMNNNHTYPDLWEQIVAKNPNKPFMLFEEYSYSYQAIDDLANRIAHWGISIGLKCKDTVALFMQNRPEFFAFWMGMSKIGVISALINYNIKGDSLIHSLKISRAKIVVVGAKVIEPIVHISKGLVKEGWQLFWWDQLCADRKPFSEKQDMTSPSNYTSSEWSDLILLDKIVSKQLKTQISREFRQGLNAESSALLIYTSGTTGLPKAAILNHLKLFTSACISPSIFKINENDRIYTALPLYHSAAGMLGIGLTVGAGATMVLRNKFSAQNFWKDCRHYKVTVIQYIGELLRYLLATPRAITDAKNQVRLAIGNGLRPDIWEEFQERFGVPCIGEFYGATEGNIFLMNYCTTKEAMGAVGRTGYLMNKLQKMKLVKFDVENETIIRGSDGWAIECGYDEPGELLGFVDTNNPATRFLGYLGNKKANKKKIATNVFREGDMYFRTGDLLMRNRKGYWYFVDRIGDTFRWKGENVSTNEVAQVVSLHHSVLEVNIYGVAIPGKDGCACMAAMIVKDDMNWEDLAKHCRDKLPSYSVPLFIRILPKITVTGTFKHQKVQLRKDGADPTLVKDPIMWLDGNTYHPLDLPAWKNIIGGKAKL